MLKMTCVCGCGWTSSRPQAACLSCGQAICPQCGNHTLSVARWAGDDSRVLLDRVQRHVQDVLMQAAMLDSMYGEDAAGVQAQRH
jgi:hypothetical protein